MLTGIRRVLPTGIIRPGPPVLEFSAGLSLQALPVVARCQ